MYAYPNEYADIKRRMDVLIKEQEKVVIGVISAVAIALLIFSNGRNLLMIGQRFPQGVD